MSQDLNFLSSTFLAPYEGRTPANAGRLFWPVFLRTYSRYIPELKRRERWDEAVARAVNYSIGLYQGPAPKEDLIREAEELYDKVFNLEVLPAGRTLWVGGTESSLKFPESQYNCAFRVIDGLEAFTDLFHLLLCGCGVGFRILPEDVAQLPEFCPKVNVVNEPYKTVYPNRKVDYTKFPHETDAGMIVGQPGHLGVDIYVGDSREAWVQALRLFLETSATAARMKEVKELTFNINYNFVRPEGSRIVQFGGRAPGPKGLMEMFTNLAKVITKSGGRLSPVDCMDICNFIGKNVIIGGTRRSSQVALGAPTDQEFIDAKKMLWLDKQNLQRTMSNNSIVFTERASKEQIKEIFAGIKVNGEPGFYNLSAGRKRHPYAQGSNPCLTVDTWINTVEGPRQIKDLRDKPYKAMINGVSKDATFFWSSGVKSVYKLSTKEGYSLKLTADHKVLTKAGWKEAKDLTTKDLIILNNTSSDPHEWEGAGTFEEGWLVGSLVGDGTYSKAKNENCSAQAYLRYWGEDKEVVAAQAFEYLKASVSMRSDVGIGAYRGRPYHQVSCVGLTKLAEQFGIVMGAKINITPQIEKASSKFYEGFLQGLFDADGSPQGSIAKGRSVRLSQASFEFLLGVQRMLARLGIKCTVYECRKEAGPHLLPDGKGGMKDYQCKMMSELIISRSSMYRYAERIGFSEPKKIARLADIVGAHNTRRLYTDKFEASFKSLEYIGEEEVFDCTVQDLHRFDANGMIVHNCMEIEMDNRGFCNLATVNLTAFVQGRWFDLDRAKKAMQAAARVCLRMTNITVSLPLWDAVQKRDRLLGVSITGLMDTFDALGIEFDSLLATSILANLRKAANDEADKYAFEMRIPRPLLVTTIKPEGTLSQLPTVSSGLHRGFAPYYIRRIRVSSMDPVASALKKLGVPYEADQAKSERLVFSFPIETKATKAASDEPAKRQFERYLTTMKHYTDHNSSCTLTIGENEWTEIEDMVYDNWDDVVACAFLPKYTDAYPQMPYEEITKEQYEEMMKTFPNLDNLADLVNQYENEDYEDELIDDACSSGQCPVR